MQLDLDELTRAQGWSGYKVVANLPYYITTPLVMKLLEEEAEIEDIVVMMQKEVAARLMAVPGTKEYGALTLAVQYYAEPEILFPVSRHVFQPVPQVDSAVIRLKPRKEPPVQVEDKALLFRIIKAAFGQRRKVYLIAFENTPVWRKNTWRSIGTGWDRFGSRRSLSLNNSPFCLIFGLQNKTNDIK